MIKLLAIYLLIGVIFWFFSMVCMYLCVVAIPVLRKEFDVLLNKWNAYPRSERIISFIEVSLKFILLWPRELYGMYKRRKERMKND